jgi:hypothetical protein
VPDPGATVEPAIETDETDGLKPRAERASVDKIDDVVPRWRITGLSDRTVAAAVPP